MRAASEFFLALAIVGATAAGAPSAPACQQKVDKLIHSTAVAMGLTETFGLHFAVEKADKDEDPSWTILTSGTFTIDEGTISGSGATVVVKDFSKTCQILRMTVAVGR